MNGVSLFANVGIGETYVGRHGIQITVANELLSDRAEFYRYSHPEAHMVTGDITNKDIYNEVLKRSKKNKCEFLMATPPCQGMSLAGKRDPNDVRNLLIQYIVSFIKDLKPKYVLIENVPSMLKTYISVDGKDVLIQDYIYDHLSSDYNINHKVVNAADYGTPQYRKRVILLLSRGGLFENSWEFPVKQEHMTVRETIGHLPSLESGEESDIPNHRAKIHNERHIEMMSHTPEGKSAFDNEVYYPKRKDGKKVSGYSTTYKRMSWDQPAPTITMGNGGISSQNNVHPGRPLSKGLYSDARVLTLKELFLLTGLPDDWCQPPDVSDVLVRKVIGECLPPELVSSLLTTLPKKG